MITCQTSVALLNITRNKEIQEEAASISNKGKVFWSDHMDQHMPSPILVDDQSEVFHDYKSTLLMPLIQ